MNRFARRMQTLAAVEIALVLIAIIVLGALFSFGLYIRSLSHELRVTTGAVVAALSENHAANAPAAGRAIASRLVRAETEVIVLDADSRVTVFYERRNDSAPVELVRGRGDLSGNPPVTGTLAPLVLGLATAFGLDQIHDRVGSLYLIIRSNDAALVATVRSTLLPLAAAIAAAIVCGWLIARALTGQAMRPLGDLTSALERFASGDLTPQPIAADERHELSELARAYNGAIAQMEHAFAERDRADASMRQFIADAGHQLRTPLTVVQGFISILRGAESQAERERILATMYQQSRAMGSLIDKLILLERWEDPQEQPHEPIDVGVLVEDLAGVLADANPQRSITVSNGGETLAAIDPTDLGYIINNLVDNALKYTDGPVDVNVSSEGDAVIVDVADTGPGMTPADAAHVFDRFYRVGRRGVEGTGLGLSIAKRAAERARGSIDVTSTPPEGSRFRVRLPRAVRA
ncbi:MAG TPA: HAMP domain-containing sensor histidine kinase [Candidatus Baltobacteraceae bacterium]|jgi:signal transduction histidine kinase